MRAVFITPLIIAFALFMESLDSTILSTALPAIAQDLNEDPINLKLALTSYMLAAAIFIPASGWAADRFGSRTVLSCAILVFTLGSILSGLCSTLPQLVAARVVQGAGGAMMVPVGRLIVFRSVPRSELVQALTYLTVPALMGPVLGPLLGGFITTYFDWRWIFWVNMPIGLIGLVFTQIYIKNYWEKDPPKLDFVGFVESGIGLAALNFGLTMLDQGGLSYYLAIALIIIGLASLILYVLHACKIPNPILDLRLLQLKTFRVGVVGGFVFRIGIGALPFLIPLLLQLGFGLNPLEAGLLTFATAVGSIAMKTTARPILRRFGFRNVLLWNGFISALFLFFYGFFTQQTSHWLILLSLLGGGFFRSLEFTSLNAISYDEVNDQQMSKATSFASVVQQLSQSIGVSVGAAALELSRYVHHDLTLAVEDFRMAFFAVGFISLSALASFRTLSADAGSEISGNRPKNNTMS